VGYARATDAPDATDRQYNPGMPVVFVHGVNTRKGPGYEATTEVVETFLRKHFPGLRINNKPLGAVPRVWFPYWGDLGTTFAWDMASLPQRDMQKLGGVADVDLQPLLAHIRDALPNVPRGQPLVALAKKKLSLAVDVVNDLALDDAAAGQERDIARFVVASSGYAEANPSPAWLNQVTTDEQFLARLQAELRVQVDVQARGGFGTVFNKIAIGARKLEQAVKKMAGTVVDKSGDFVSTKLLAATRDSLNATLGRFFGDVWIYMDGRGTAAAPGPIPRVILEDFDAARQAAPNEPLIIMGHSLGGVISMDLLSSFRPDIEVDLFISVGSQVAHFEEIKLYKASNKAIVKPQKAPTPANIKRWINVYDEVDIFSYSVERVYDRVNFDMRYDTETYTVKAHGAYLRQDRFYERLRARIDQLPQ
jgi:hypothetical protein